MGATRRQFLATGAGAAVVAAAAPRLQADWQPSARYPDPAIKILDPSFTKYRVNSAKVERLGTGYRWSEGPAWFGDGRYRKPSNNANGNTRDRQGRLLTCEHDARRVTRTEYDGTITVIAERFEGKPLNSPNDIVCKSDGSIWFTDPPFGVLGFYEGHRATPELPTNVYRVDPGNGRLAVVAADVNRPNGLAFSPDESSLYVVEAGTSPRSILAFNVVGGVRLSGKRSFIDAGPGTPDGLRVDVDGSLWIGWGMGEESLDGVAVFSAEGKPIGRIDLPERCANVCFGGALRNRLFMAASTSLYSLYVNTQGVAGG